MLKEFAIIIIIIYLLINAFPDKFRLKLWSPEHLVVCVETSEIE